jgi:hypothetical protein
VQQLNATVYKLRTVLPAFIGCGKSTMQNVAAQPFQFLTSATAGVQQRLSIFAADVKAGVGPISLSDILFAALNKNSAALIEILEQGIEVCVHNALANTQVLFCAVGSGILVSTL